MLSEVTCLLFRLYNDQDKAGNGNANEDCSWGVLTGSLSFLSSPSFFFSSLPMLIYVVPNALAQKALSNSREAPSKLLVRSTYHLDANTPLPALCPHSQRWMKEQDSSCELRQSHLTLPVSAAEP